jgi:glycosyltransferase XagB
LVIAPPLWPFFTALIVHDLGAGLPSPASAFELIEVMLWMSAGLFGTASILWLALLGMKRRKLLGRWPFLPLLPLYYLLTSAAAWMALCDLILQPYHWHKTEHGLAKTSRQSTLTLAARTAADVPRLAERLSGEPSFILRALRIAPARDVAKKS